MDIAKTGDVLGKHVLFNRGRIFNTSRDPKVCLKSEHTI